jgi:hypothetical protein
MIWLDEFFFLQSEPEEISIWIPTTVLLLRRVDEKYFNIANVDR